MVKLYSCNDVELATTNTDANGNYIFNNLPVGDYYVHLFFLQVTFSVLKIKAQIVH